MASTQCARSPTDEANMSIATDIATASASPCQACGACCSYSRNWPRFTIEDDAALDLIPAQFVNARLSGMRCDGERCSALTGKVGEATACGIYAVRPEVCRTCMPGDTECAMARRRFGLPVLPARDDIDE
jgi:Fe-S-cluster containining protein